MATYYIYLPFNPNESTNPSVGPINVTAPTQATEIAGVNPEGALTPVSVSDNGYVNVNATFGGTVTTDTNIEGLNSFQTTQYIVGTSEIQITNPPLTNRSSISLKVVATGANAIFICQASGSVLTEGFPLYNGDNLQMDLTPSGNIYVQATAAGQNLYVLEIA